MARAKRDPVYNVWLSMKNRCNNPNSFGYHRYGGRGISVCDRWQRSFSEFKQDMGDRPEGYQIDRTDNDGNYTPGNCKWVTCAENMKNRSGVHKITFDGIEYYAHEIAQKYGFKTDTIMNRYKTVETFAELIAKERRVYRAGLALGGMASGAVKQAQTHCKHGHKFTVENTKTTKQGWRKCRECIRIRDSKRDRRKK